MSDVPKKSSKLIVALLLIVALGVVGYILYTKKVKAQIVTPSEPDTGGGATTDTATNPAGIITGGMVKVAINAVSPQDPYPRDWNIFDKDPSGSYIGGGKWTKAEPLARIVLTSGNTWTYELPKGKDYYLVIGCSDGVNTYSGTITPAGSTPIAFANNDVNHASKFGV